MRIIDTCTISSDISIVFNYYFEIVYLETNIELSNIFEFKVITVIHLKTVIGK
jgi:hypothetical protein